jgi:phage-related protein
MFKKVQISDISFNDNNNYLIDGFKGLEMPQTRVVSYNLPGEHFGVFVSAFYSARKFSLSGWVIGETQADFIAKRDDLQNALNILSGEQSIKFTLANDRAIQIEAIYSSITFVPQAGAINAAQFQIEFSASFPFLVSQVENSANLYLPAGGGGKVPPDTMPMSLNADSGGSSVVANNGNGVYYPFIRIFGPVTNPGIKNMGTNKEIRFDVTLAAGEYIEIDFKRKTISDNQGRNRYSVKSGEWWYIQPGSNQIKFLADTYNALAHAIIYYRDCYLGI